MYNVYMLFAVDKSIPPLMRTKRNRVWELDFLRGFAIIAMCFDHLMCDFVFLRYWFPNYNKVNNSFIVKLARFANMYWDSAFRFWAHYTFVFVFLFLVGTSCAFSRDNVKRGSQLFVVAWIFTGASLIMKKIGFLDDGIIFGILDCIALSILCAAAVDISTKRSRIVNIFAPLVLGVVIISVGIYMEFWNLGRPYDGKFTASHLIDYIIGTRGFGDDWFGLFPNVGAVLLGMYFGKAAYGKRVSLLPRLDGKWNKPVNFVGRHALLFYIIHQVVIAGVVAAICMCLGYRM